MNSEQPSGDNLSAADLSDLGAKVQDLSGSPAEEIPGTQTSAGEATDGDDTSASTQGAAVSETKALVVPKTTGSFSAAAPSSSVVPAKANQPGPAKPKSVAPPSSATTATSQGSLVSRVAAILEIDAGRVPKGIVMGNTSTDLRESYFHVMVYGKANSRKTSTGGMFVASLFPNWNDRDKRAAYAAERTRIIVTRRKEQMIPLADYGYHYAVTTDADSLKYALLYPEKLFGDDWANRKDRVLQIDDVTEGVAMLVSDHTFYVNNKGETHQIKDPRQAYKKAGDEMHDYIKINLGKPQHVILTAVERGFEVEGTIDYRIEPDVPNKIMHLLETELEYVFYMEEGDNGKMLTQPKVVTRTGTAKNPATGAPDMWREITFAKTKLPMKLLGKKVLANQEEKDLAVAWDKIQRALKGEWKPEEPPKQIGNRPQSSQSVRR